ncbi:hypothetical protein PFISCL1PPCAC_23308, partial [Pristionchus fissidentatus]
LINQIVHIPCLQNVQSNVKNDKKTVTMNESNTVLAGVTVSLARSRIYLHSGDLVELVTQSRHQFLSIVHSFLEIGTQLLSLLIHIGQLLLVQIRHILLYRDRIDKQLNILGGSRDETGVEIAVRLVLHLLVGIESAGRRRPLQHSHGVAEVSCLLVDALLQLRQSIRHL